MKKNKKVKVASALHFIHSKNIVHRDIKPENILLNTNLTAKLTDFGLACVVMGPLYRVCGTPTYVAPEVLMQQGFSSRLLNYCKVMLILRLWTGGGHVVVGHPSPHYAHRFCAVPMFRSNSTISTHREGKRLFFTTMLVKNFSR